MVTADCLSPNHLANARLKRTGQDPALEERLRTSQSPGVPAKPGGLATLCARAEVTSNRGRAQPEGRDRPRREARGLVCCPGGAGPSSQGTCADWFVARKGRGLGTPPRASRNLPQGKRPPDRCAAAHLGAASLLTRAPHAVLNQRLSLAGKASAAQPHSLQRFRSGTRLPGKLRKLEDRPEVPPLRSWPRPFRSGLGLTGGG